VLLIIFLTLVAPLFGAQPVAARFDGRFAGGFGAGGEGYVRLSDDNRGYRGVVVQPGAGYVLVGDVRGSLRAARVDRSGRIDRSFGAGGTVDLPVGEYAFGRAAAVMPDGAIIIAGRSDSDFVVARLHADGTPDRSFGVDGVVTTNIAVDPSGPYQSIDAIQAVLVQPDGKIVAGGGFDLCGDWSCPDQGFALVRYLSDGALDTTFGTDGIVTTPFTVDGEGARGIYALALQSDGRIIATGAAIEDDTLPVVRYLPDGRLDPGFGKQGVQTYSGPGSGLDLAVAPDGAVLVLTTQALVRLQPDGARDPAFGDDGSLAFAVGDGPFSARRFSVHADGRVTVVGQTDGDLVVARYMPDGELDWSMGGVGYAQNPINAPDGIVLINAAARDGHALMVLAGAIRPTAHSYLIRLNDEGRLDEAGGYVETRISVQHERITALAVQPNGAIIAAGYADHSEGPNPAPTMALMRVSPKGQFDRTFGDDGIARTRGAYGSTLALAPDGAIVVAGTTLADPQGHQRVVVRRYTADGQPDGDVSFARGLYLNFGRRSAQAGAVLPQADGAIIIGGSALENGRWDLALARYLADGRLDQSFGDGGVALLALDGDTRLRAALLLPNGKLLVAGDLNRVGSLGGGTIVARFLANGALDPSFGAGQGYVVADLGPSQGLGLAVQPDGKLLTGAVVEANGQRFLTALRYLPDGAPDATYGAEGVSRLARGYPGLVGAGLALDAGGGLTLVGYAGAEVVLARLSRNGAPDPFFGSAGTTTGMFGATSAAGAAIFHPGLNAVVVGGSRAHSPTDSGIAVGLVPGSYPRNSAPQVQGGRYRTLPGVTLTAPAPGLLAGASDAEGDPLSLEVSQPPAHGDLVVEADGAFRYTPRAGFSGDDRFFVQASDGLTLSEPAEVRIHVSAPEANTPPTAVTHIYTTIAGAPLVLPAPGVLAGAADANGDTLTAYLETGPRFGKLELSADGAFRYTPNAGFSGEDDFSYRVSDGAAASAPAHVTVHVLAPDGTLPAPAPEPLRYTVYAPIISR
jgi:uncharacterized delta-60 repeat protein